MTSQLDSLQALGRGGRDAWQHSALGHFQGNLSKRLHLKAWPSHQSIFRVQKSTPHRIHTNSSCISTVFCKIFMIYLDAAAWVG